MPKMPKSVHYSGRQGIAQRNWAEISSFLSFVSFVLFVVNSGRPKIKALDYHQLFQRIIADALNF
jgi:hypothetical protein